MDSNNAKSTIILLVVLCVMVQFVGCGVTLLTPETLKNFPKDFSNCSGA